MPKTKQTLPVTIERLIEASLLREKQKIKTRKTSKPVDDELAKLSKLMPFTRDSHVYLDIKLFAKTWHKQNAGIIEAAENTKHALEIQETELIRLVNEAAKPEVVKAASDRLTELTTDYQAAYHRCREAEAEALRTHDIMLNGYENFTPLRDGVNPLEAMDTGSEIKEEMKQLKIIIGNAFAKRFPTLPDPTALQERARKLAVASTQYQSIDQFMRHKGSTSLTPIHSLHSAHLSRLKISEKAVKKATDDYLKAIKNREQALTAKAKKEKKGKTYEKSIPTTDKERLALQRALYQHHALHQAYGRELHQAKEAFIRSTIDNQLDKMDAMGSVWGLHASPKQGHFVKLLTLRAKSRKALLDGAGHYDKRYLNFVTKQFYRLPLHETKPMQDKFVQAPSAISDEAFEEWSGTFYEQLFFQIANNETAQTLGKAIGYHKTETTASFAEPVSAAGESVSTVQVKSLADGSGISSTRSEDASFEDDAALDNADTAPNDDGATKTSIATGTLFAPVKARVEFAPVVKRAAVAKSTAAVDTEDAVHTLSHTAPVVA